jgi:hypothetical protein
MTVKCYPNLPSGSKDIHTSFILKLAMPLGRFFSEVKYKLWFPWLNAFVSMVTSLLLYFCPTAKYS